MVSSAFIHQLLVSGSVLLAALSVGCSITYPSVLLKQFASNNSSIKLDLDTASWIGSIHGLAGIPSIVMPAIMQWKGRKFTFIASCLFSITGWVLVYTATSSAYILLSESVHGFGSQSVMAVGSLAMTELLSPQFKQVSLVLYLVVQASGMALVEVVGWHMHWKNVSLVVSMPIVVAALAACLWPESPSWLAYKGEFEKCTQAFTRLRGNNDRTKAELEELILAQRENLIRDKWNKQISLKNFWRKLKRRDFYLPSFHIFVTMSMVYWSGGIPIVIYASEIVQYKHKNKAVLYEGIILNSTYVICCIINIILKHYFKLKKVLLVGIVCTIVCLLCCSAVNFTQTVGLISEESNIFFYLLIAYMVAISSGVMPTVFTLDAELMPVKHRGVGGPLYVIFMCTLHTSSLKLAPYLFLYINVWGTFLLYALNTIICGFIVWKYIPETNGRTLQQLEDYYTYGNFDNPSRLHTQNVYLTQMT